MRRIAVLACLALLIGGGALAKSPLRKPARGFQVKVGEYTIQPGEDLEVCEYRRLPNPKPMDVAGFRLRMPAGAHHFALWAYGGPTTDDSLFPQGPVESVGCNGLAHDDFFPQLLIPTQSPNVRLKFPKGMALRIEADQQVWLNPHMRNFGTAPMEPDIRFNVVPARKGTVKHLVHGFTVGNMSSIRIPAGGDQTITVDWAAPVNMNIIQLATHQHRLGTYARIDAQMPDGSMRDRVVETFDWEHPDSEWPPGGIRLAKGRKLRITCSWHNTENHEVRFGPETTDEMCFIIGFFYRDTGDTEPVVGGGCLTSTKGLLCPLAPAVSN
jgi:hypothetical protein